MGVSDELGETVFAKLQGPVDEFCQQVADQLPSDALVGVLPFAYLPGPGPGPEKRARYFGVRFAEYFGDRLERLTTGRVLESSELKTKLQNPDTKMPQTFWQSGAVDCRGRLACLDVVLYGYFRRVSPRPGIQNLEARVIAFDVYALSELARSDILSIPVIRTVRIALIDESPWEVVDKFEVDPADDWATEMSLKLRVTGRTLDGWLKGVEREELRILVLPLDLRDLVADHKSLFTAEEQLDGADPNDVLEIDGINYTYVEAQAEVNSRRKKVIGTSSHRFAQTFARKVRNALNARLGAAADVRCEVRNDPILEKRALSALSTKNWRKFARGFDGPSWVADVVVRPRILQVSSEGYEIIAEFYVNGELARVVTLHQGSTRALRIHRDYKSVVVTALKDGELSNFRDNERD